MPTIKLIENCEWNDWQLGDCSATCGGGTRVDIRTKAKVEAHGGTCDDNENEREVDCNTEDCPRNHWRQIIYKLIEVSFY